MLKKALLITILFATAIFLLVNFGVYKLTKNTYSINLQYLGEKWNGSKRICYFFDEFIYFRIYCKDYDYIKSNLMDKTNN